MAKDRSYYPDIGDRLRAIREGFSDLNKMEWAERHGIGQSRWHQWESGARRIPVEEAERLCALYGLTLDFIYLGRRDALSEKASKAL